MQQKRYSWYPIEHKFTLLFALIVAVLIYAPSTVFAQPAQPLLMEGKRTLFQRILTRPGATLMPCAKSLKCTPTKDDELAPLSIFYVYAKEQNGEVLLLIGPNARGTVIGFVKASQTIPWKHSLVLSFEQRAGRNRVLFFDEKDSLLDFAVADTLSIDLESAYSAISANKPPPFDSIIAAEPANFVDIREQFYLLPILQAEETRIRMGGETKRTKVKAVEVASASQKAQTSEPLQPEASTRVNPKLENFNSAIVFVLDASGSMQHEIDSARKTILDIYKRIETEGHADKVRFGLIGYRDDPSEVEGVEYLSKIFVDPAKVDSSDEFLTAAKALAASPVSTRSWAEDGYAGIMDAVQKVNWDEFGGRYIIFITDASSRGPTAKGDVPASSTKLSARGINQLALEKEIATYTLHILTPEAERRGDIEVAQTQYTALSRFPGLGSLYYGVTSARSDENKYRDAVTSLAEALVEQVKTTSGGELTPDPLQAAANTKPAALDAVEKSQAVGRAMQLSYLGKLEKTAAPPLFRAWAIDGALDRPTTRSLKVRLLLTKDQLSDLRKSVQGIYDAAVETELEPQAFLNQLTSVAVKMGRDPAVDASGGIAGSLEDTKLLGEYLDGLPYASPAMDLTEDTWMSMGPGQQGEFQDDLLNKLEQYRHIHDDVNNWINLHEEDEPGDAVYPVPLDLLP